MGFLEVGVDPAGTDDEDVAVLELDALSFGAVSDLVQRDGTGSEWIIGLLLEAPNVNQYATAHYSGVGQHIVMQDMANPVLTNSMVGPGFHAHPEGIVDMVLSDLDMAALVRENSTPSIRCRRTPL